MLWHIMHKNKIIIDSCVFNKLFLEKHNSEQAVDLMSTLAQKIIVFLPPVCFCMKCYLSQKLTTFQQ
jgi:hypothetical protein